MAMPHRSMNQLLEIRLDALEKDVGKVKKVVGDTRIRTDSIRDINARFTSESANGVREPLLQILALANRVGSVLRQSPQIREEIGHYDRTLADALSSDLPNQVEHLNKLLEAVRGDIREINDDLVRLLPAQVELLEMSLEERCHAVRERIGQLRAAAAGSAARPRVYRGIWEMYDRMLKEAARPLFAEYVDFVGGLAVRDHALDNRVCQMTDELLRDLSHVTMNSLSVPAQQAALGSVMKSVIKLGFPEWTIWGIPLVGHEVGLSIAENERSINRLVRQRRFGMSKEPLKSLFADIFATYTLGPAYACAAILLRFEPHHTMLKQGEPSDIDRARLILDVLGRLGASSGENTSGEVTTYYEIVDQLKKLWQDAVDNLKPQDDRPSPPHATRSDLDDFLDATWEILSNAERFHAFDRVRWLATDDWLAALRGNPARARVRGTNDVIELLTAAWRARLMDAAQTDRIAENASLLWPYAADVTPSTSETIPRRPAGLSRPLDTEMKEPRI
jgi:hypothetical protein